MRRLSRLHVPSGLYYVALSGTGGEAIFHESRDFVEFDALVARSLRRYRCRLHAFCWLEERVLMAIQVSDVPVWRFVQHVSSRYSKYLHGRLNLTGHLFEHYRRALLVQRSRYLLPLVRHIHRAPVRDGLVSESKDYPRSGDRAYRDLERVPWLTTHVANEMLRHAGHPGLVSYSDWMSQDDGPFAELFDHPSARALGDDGFLATIAVRVRPPRTEGSLDQISARVARVHGVPLASILSRSQRHQHVLVRAVIAWEATQSGVASLKEVAEHFSRDPSTLWSAIERYRTLLPELFPEHPLAEDGKDSEVAR